MWRVALLRYTAADSQRRAASDHADRFLYGPAVRPVHQARAGRAVRRVLAGRTALRPGSAGGARRCCSAASPRCFYMWRGCRTSFVSIGIGNAALIAAFACCWQGARAFDRRRPLWSRGRWRAGALARGLLRAGLHRRALPYRIVLSSGLIAPLLAMAGVRVLARPRRTPAVALAGHRDLRARLRCSSRPAFR